MRTKRNDPARALVPTLFVGTCVLAVVMTIGKIMEIAAGTPKVGDMVVFTPSAVGPAGEDIRLLVHRQDRYGCVLDLATLQRSGGSLVVETEISTQERMFRVHWAGARTSADNGNCGKAADLIIDHRDVDLLALAAGGYGLGPKRSPVFIRSRTE